MKVKLSGARVELNPCGCCSDSVSVSEVIELTEEQFQEVQEVLTDVTREVYNLPFINTEERFDYIWDAEIE